MKNKNKTALVLGASGLVGNELVNIMIQQNKYERIHVLVREPIGIKDLKCEQHIVDFDNLQKYSELFQVTDVFCCLGTTIKKAKSKVAFRKVDFGYPVEAATLAKEKCADKFLIISAMGANTNSFVFYNQVKGQLEESLAQLNLPSLHIFRPSLLLGERKEFRFGEKMASKASGVLNTIMIGPLRPYKAIEAKKVATAMAHIANTDKKGVNIYSSNEIERIAMIY
jgi:uncharacterized protein YbjT (DUF2867 family)